MKIGDIVVVSGNSIISKIIKKVVGSKWTHVAIYVGGGYFLEIDWSKKASLVKDPYTFGEWDHVIMTTKKPLSKQQQMKIISTACAFNRQGNRYDWPLLLALCLKAKFPNTKALNWLNGKNTYICTELVNKVMRESSVELFPGHDEIIFPDDFLKSPVLKVVRFVEGKTA